MYTLIIMTCFESVDWTW